MRGLTLVLTILLSACGTDSGSNVNSTGNGGGTSGPKSDPRVELSANATSILEGETAQLVWQGEDVDSCLASGTWSGEKPITGEEDIILTTEGVFLFVLTCTEALTGESVSDQLSITVLPEEPPTGDKKSGRDSEDAQALFEHYNQYTQ